MAHNFEEIVREWYERLKPEFQRKLTRSYPGLTLADAENIYQDTFVAVYDNINNGRVKEETSWTSYIMRIGMNLASKEWRKAGKNNPFQQDGTEDPIDAARTMARKVEEKVRELEGTTRVSELAKDQKAVGLLGEVLKYTPPPCNRIIYLFYEEQRSMAQIAELVGLKNAQTAKVKKSQCMKDYIRRGRDLFKREGLF